MKRDDRNRAPHPKALEAAARLRAYDEGRSRGEGKNHRFDCSRPLTAPGTVASSSSLPSGGALPPGGFRAICVGGCSFVRLPSPGASTEQCWRPNQFRCKHCYRVVSSTCGGGSVSKCAPCAELKRGDWAAIARSGLGHEDSSVEAFVTLTAPGASVLPWDTARCSHGPTERCSGTIGCKVERDALARWNVLAVKQWSYFRQSFRRAFPGCDLAYMKAWELQQREALHVHALVRVVGAVNLEQFEAWVASWAESHGFGKQYVVDSIAVADELKRAQKAGYCAKYASKGYDDLSDVPTVMADGSTGARRVRPCSTSRAWGDTLKVCRERRRGWSLGGVGGDVHAPAGAAPAAPLTCTTKLPQDPSVVDLPSSDLAVIAG